MTKSQLIETVSEKLTENISKTDAELIVNLLFKSMADALKNGGRVEIRGFGSFKTVSREARTGRNPKNGDKVNIPAKKVVHFKPGKELKKKVDN